MRVQKGRAGVFATAGRSRGKVIPLCVDKPSMAHGRGASRAAPAMPAVPRDQAASAVSASTAGRSTKKVVPSPSWLT